MSTVVARERRRVVRNAALFYLFHWGAYGAYVPFLNVHFIKLGFSGGQLGLLAMLFPLGVLLCSPSLSALADRLHRRVLILQIALTGVVLSFVALGYPTSFGAVTAVMVLLAVARSPILALADTLIVRMAIRHDIGYGNLRLIGSFGFAILSIFCGWLWQQWGYRPLFWTTAALFLPTIWLASQLEDETERDRHGQQVPLRAIMQNRYLAMLLVTTWLMGITLGIAIIFEGILVDALGGGEAMIGLFLGIIGLSEIPGMRISGNLIGRLGDQRTLLLSYLIFGSSFVGYLFVTTPSMLMLFGAIRGFGFGLFLATTITTFNAHAPVAWAATVQALRDAVMFGLAPLLIAPPAGLIFAAWGVKAPFVFGIGTAAVAVLILAVSARGLDNTRSVNAKLDNAKREETHRIEKS